MATAEPATLRRPASVLVTRRQLTIAAAGSLVAAFLHAAIVPEHLAEAMDGEVLGWLPLAFAVTAGLGIGWALGLVYVGNLRPWLWFGLVGHAAMTACGVWSRTLGLPGMEVEGVSAVFALAVAAELVVVVVCAVLLATDRGSVEPAPATAPGLATVLVLALCAAVLTWGLTGSEVIEHAHMLGTWAG